MDQLIHILGGRFLVPSAVDAVKAVPKDSGKIMVYIRLASGAETSVEVDNEDQVRKLVESIRKGVDFTSY